MRSPCSVLFCGLRRGSCAHPAVIHHVGQPPRVRQCVADWFCAITAALPIVSTQKSKQRSPLRSHYGARFHAPLLIDACVIVPQRGRGAPGSLSHHSNNPIESAGGRGAGRGGRLERGGPTCFCSLAKCQESSWFVFFKPARDAQTELSPIDTCAA